MTRFKNKVKKKSVDKIVYGNKIVDGIVYIALTEIPYVELFSITNTKKDKKKFITVKFEKDGVHIEVVVRVHYSQSISETAFKIQESIIHNVESTVDYHVAGVNVMVRGVIFDDMPLPDNRSRFDGGKTEEGQTENVGAMLFDATTPQGESESVATKENIKEEKTTADNAKKVEKTEKPEKPTETKEKEESHIEGGKKSF